MIVRLPFNINRNFLFVFSGSVFSIFIRVFPVALFGVDDAEIVSILHFSRCNLYIDLNLVHSSAV